MDLQKFTERSQGFLQAAQTAALTRGHQQLLPEHLLKVLLDDEEGLAANLIRSAGGQPEAAAQARKPCAVSRKCTSVVWTPTHLVRRRPAR